MYFDTTIDYIVTGRKCIVVDDEEHQKSSSGAPTEFSYNNNKIKEVQERTRILRIED